MKKYQLNIGLNNNPYTAGELVNIIANTLGLEGLRYRVLNGEYKTNEEPTLVLEGLTSKSLYSVVKLVDLLNTAATQDCIPFIYDGFKKLKYNEECTGHRLEFDPAYFLTLN